MIKNLDLMVQRIGLKSIPESWRDNWQGFADWRSCGRCGMVRFEVTKSDAELLDLPAQSIEVLERAMEAVRADVDLALLAELWHYLLYHIPKTGDNPSAWPNPEKLMGEMATMFPLVVLVSGLHHALESFRELSIPEDIVRATMADVGLWVGQHHQKHGVWGLGEMIWLRRHIRARIFRLGRLQFAPGRFHLPFRLFQNVRTGEILPLCEAGRKYRNDGMADGTNDVSDPDAWTSEIEQEPEWVKGSPVNAAGEAVKEKVTLRTDEWKQIATPDTDALEVHIPRGDKLAPEHNAEAFRLAHEFFPRHFPDRRFVAFTCSSWMLDPALQVICPAESNLAQFQRLWTLVPTPGNEVAAFVFVFGDRVVDLASAPRDTTLRRAIIDYLTAGNHMRGTAGFIPW